MGGDKEERVREGLEREAEKRGVRERESVGRGGGKWGGEEVESLKPAA